MRSGDGLIGGGQGAVRPAVVLQSLRENLNLEFVSLVSPGQDPTRGGQAGIAHRRPNCLP
jgi:hypothetical protein